MGVIFLALVGALLWGSIETVHVQELEKKLEAQQQVQKEVE